MSANRSLDLVIRRLAEIVKATTPGSDSRHRFRCDVVFDRHVEPIDAGRNRHREVTIVAEGFPMPHDDLSSCWWDTAVRIDLRLQTDQVQGASQEALIHNASKDVMALIVALTDPEAWQTAESTILSVTHLRNGGRTTEADPQAGIASIYLNVLHQECPA